MKTTSLFILFLVAFTETLAYPINKLFCIKDSTAQTKRTRIVETDSDSLATKKVMLISTNFNVPMVQYVPLINTTTKKGDISFFNAVGAGIGFSIADIEFARDKNGKIINTEVKNNIGIQTGFLFSSNAVKDGSSNQFAWTLSLVFLDFQVGYGHQFGTIVEGQYRNFMNFSYSIPLSKLSKAGSLILRYKGKNTNFKTMNKAQFLN